MYVTYFDEVKPNPRDGQSSYVVGGVSVRMDRIPAIERKLNDLSLKLFNSTEPTSATEFHAGHIYQAKGAFKGMRPTDRLDILQSLARILAEEDGVKRVYASIDITKLELPDRAAEFAFAHFCERVQLLIGKAACSILIGDLDEQHAKKMIGAFARYRASGTPWRYGIEISSVVDCVHFARSCHSRMIQLADAYVFLLTHGARGRSGRMAAALAEMLSEFDLHAHRYKIWPKG